MADEATVRTSLEQLVEMIDELDPATRAKIPDATLSVLVRDLDVAYAARIESGEAYDLREIDPALAHDATLRITANSDVVVDVIEGRLHFGHGWATGRIRVDAKFRDLLKLRSFL